MEPSEVRSVDAPEPTGPPDQVLSIGELVDEWGEESFPASDPPANY